MLNHLVDERTSERASQNSLYLLKKVNSLKAITKVLWIMNWTTEWMLIRLDVASERLTGSKAELRESEPGSSASERSGNVSLKAVTWLIVMS